MNEESQEIARNIVRYIHFLEKKRRYFLDERLGAYRLSGSTFMIILFLDRNPGASQDDLADFLLINKSSVARTCRQLADLGYIRREQSSQDRRLNNLYLTGSGQGLLPVIRELLAEWRDQVTCGMCAEDQQVLLRLLAQMLEKAE
jgi:DNA-binding MarR family transcriptional regulator